MKKKMFLKRREVKDNQIDVGVIDILEHQLDKFEDGESVDIVIMKYVKHPKVAPVKDLLYTNVQIENIACPTCGWGIDWRYSEDGDGDLYSYGCCGKMYYAQPQLYKLDIEDDEDYVEEEE